MGGVGEGTWGCMNSKKMMPIDLLIMFTYRLLNVGASYGLEHVLSVMEKARVMRKRSP
jgi:hypothetical protein